MASLEAEHPETDRGIGARVIPEPLARPLPMRAVTRSGAARAGLRAGDRRARPAPRVHERREPAARARDGAPARDGRARGARRELARGSSGKWSRKGCCSRASAASRGSSSGSGSAPRTSRASTSARICRSDSTCPSTGTCFCSRSGPRSRPAWRSGSGPRGARRAPTRARRFMTAARATRTAWTASACAACSSSGKSPARSRCSSWPGCSCERSRPPNGSISASTPSISSPCGSIRGRSATTRPARPSSTRICNAAWPPGPTWPRSPSASPRR